jgi:cytochrome c peroxidase
MMMRMSTPTSGRHVVMAAIAVAASALALSITTTAAPRAQEPPTLEALPAHVESPPDNPTTPEKVALGRLLFWDPILSGSEDIACATCHHPDFGYTDGRDLPIGTGGRGLGPTRVFPGGEAPLVKRNSQTILNVAFNGIGMDGHVDPAEAPMFWDARARGLEAQALVPIENLEEMRGPRVPEGRGVAEAVRRVSRVKEYQTLFARAFGGSAAVTPDNLARAIAAFERTLITADAPFDRYMRGDHTALSEVQRQGMASFESHGCIQCHNGPMFSDFKFHVLGVSDNPKLGAWDPGADHRFAFRTPTLRNLKYTGPYMHSGLLSSVLDVIGFYRIAATGNGFVHFDAPTLFNGHLLLASPVARDQVDPLVRQLIVIQRIDDVAEFLESLNGTFDRTIPSRVPSGLKPAGS